MSQHDTWRPERANRRVVHDRFAIVEDEWTVQTARVHDDGEEDQRKRCRSLAASLPVPRHRVDCIASPSSESVCATLCEPIVRDGLLDSGSAPAVCFEQIQDLKMQETSKDWVEVTRCNWLHEALFLQSVLDAAEIEAMIPDEHTLGVQPLYSNALGGARLLVRAEDLERASEVLNSTNESSQLNPDGGEAV